MQRFDKTEQQRTVKPITDNHICIPQNDPPILDACPAGAKPRRFGNKLMIPGTNILRPKM